VLIKDNGAKQISILSLHITNIMCLIYISNDFHGFLNKFLWLTIIGNKTTFAGN